MSTTLSSPESASAATDEQTAQRIWAITEICDRAAQGDLEARVTGLSDDPEWQPLASAINRMLDLADSFVREGAAAMDHCGRELYYRPVLLRGLKGAYRQSAGVINQAGLKMKESSDQIRYVAQMASETAANVTTVAAACEELSSTSNEISQQAGGSAALSAEAVAVAQQAGLAVTDLMGAAKKVDNIVKLINTIAGQTNLLALNATIEAARAGEAGKGFAVVAAEVKDLSRNTAKATDDIALQVRKMQETVQLVSEHMKSIDAVIARVSSSAAAISRSVGEQVDATAEISRSITGVSQNTSLISQRIGGVGR